MTALVALCERVAHASLSPAAHLVSGALQFLPPTRMLLAAALLFGKLPELSVALALERANAASGDDERHARARGGGSQVDFSEIDDGLHAAGSGVRLRDFQADVQFKAVVPHQRTGPLKLGKGEWQDQRRAATAHWQDDAPLLNAHGLGGPMDGVEALRAPGILHAHLRMLPAQLACCLNRACTDWLCRAKRPLVSCCRSVWLGQWAWLILARRWAWTQTFQTWAASIWAYVRRRKMLGDRRDRRYTRVVFIHTSSFRRLEQR